MRGRRCRRARRGRTLGAGRERARAARPPRSSVQFAGLATCPAGPSNSSTRRAWCRARAGASEPPSAGGRDRSAGTSASSCRPASARWRALVVTVNFNGAPVVRHGSPWKRALASLTKNSTRGRRVRDQRDRGVMARVDRDVAEPPRPARRERHEDDVLARSRDAGWRRSPPATAARASDGTATGSASNEPSHGDRAAPVVQAFAAASSSCPNSTTRRGARGNRRAHASGLTCPASLRPVDPHPVDGEPAGKHELEVGPRPSCRREVEDDVEPARRRPRRGRWPRSARLSLGRVGDAVDAPADEPGVQVSA